MRAVVIVIKRKGRKARSRGVFGSIWTVDENVRAVGVFYGEHRQSDGVSCDDEKKSPTGRVAGVGSVEAVRLSRRKPPRDGHHHDLGALLALLKMGITHGLRHAQYWAKRRKQDKLDNSFRNVTNRTRWKLRYANQNRTIPPRSFSPDVRSDTFHEIEVDEKAPVRREF